MNTSVYMAVSKALLHGYAEIYGLDSAQVERLEGVLHMAFLEGKTEGMHEAFNSMNKVTFNTSENDAITIQSNC